MNIFFMKNWYHFDLNQEIINYMKKEETKSKKDKIKSRMDKDFKLKID